MPRDREGAANCQGKTEEESQYKRRMRELLDTFLDRQPRIPFGIKSAGRSCFSHLLGGIGAESRRRQEGEEGDDDYDTGDVQRSPKMETRAITVC